MLRKTNKIRLFLRIPNNQTNYLQKYDVSVKDTFEFYMHSQT